jgi:hypothetical protein
VFLVSDLTDLELSFLLACQELVIYQQELAPFLADTLGIRPDQLLYHWKIDPDCRQSGTLADGEWRYFFHGLECDLENVQDGRFLRLDFGPQGRLDTFTGWGVLQFIMAAKPPWREFPALRDFLAEKPPPYHRLSGSHQKMHLLADHLWDSGLVETADPHLCSLVQTWQHIEPDGKHVTKLPPEYTGITNSRFWDTFVCGRWVLSNRGKDVIREAV